MNKTPDVNLRTPYVSSAHLGCVHTRAWIPMYKTPHPRERERDLNLDICKEFPALQCVLYKEILTLVNVWFSSPVSRSPQIPLLWWSNSEKHQARGVVMYLQLLLTHTLHACAPLECNRNDLPLKMKTDGCLSTRVAWWIQPDNSQIPKWHILRMVHIHQHLSTLQFKVKLHKMI